MTKGKSTFYDLQASLVGRCIFAWDTVPQMRHKSNEEMIHLSSFAYT